MNASTTISSKKFMVCMLFSCTLSFMHAFPELLRAIRNNKVDEAAGMIAQGSDLAVTDHNGNTAMHYAAQCGSVELMQQLARAGLSCTTPNKCQETPLNQAIFHGQMTAVRWLVEEQNVDVNAHHPIFGSPLNSATAKGYTDIVQYLVDHGASIIHKKFPTLYYAVQSRNIELVRFFLERNCHPNERRVAGGTVLHAAILNPEILALLLAQDGVDVDAQSADYEQTPLHTAAFLGIHESARLLLKAGANPDLENSHGHTALDRAQQYKKQNIVTLLRGPRSDIEALPREPVHIRRHTQDIPPQLPISQAMNLHDIHPQLLNSMPPLIEAVVEQQEDVVTDMISKKADLNVADAHGRTALHYLASTGNLPILHQLLAAGADPNKTDNKGYIPLHIATDLEHVQTVAALLDAGADQYAHSDDSGSTPLHWASKNPAIMEEFARRNKLDVSVTNKNNLTMLHAAATIGKHALTYLLSTANMRNQIDAQTFDGDTPLHIAASSRNFESVQTLLQYGAKKDIKNNQGDIPFDIALEQAQNGEALHALRMAKLLNPQQQSQNQSLPTVESMSSLATDNDFDTDSDFDDDYIDVGQMLSDSDYNLPSDDEVSLEGDTPAVKWDGALTRNLSTYVSQELED